MTRHDLTVDVSVDDCEAPSGLRPWLRDSSAYAKPSDRLKPRLRLLHDIMMFEVVGKFTKQSIGDILAKDWVVKRCADIAWTPTRAGLNQMKRKMAMLFSAQIDDEEGGATERHAESWEVALQSDMLRECALDARKGQDVEFMAADKGAKPVRAKITAVHSPSRGTDDEHFNLALPDGSEIRYVRRECIGPISSGTLTSPSITSTPTASPAARRASIASPPGSLARRISYMGGRWVAGERGADSQRGDVKDGAGAASAPRFSFSTAPDAEMAVTMPPSPRTSSAAGRRRSGGGATGRLDMLSPLPPRSTSVPFTARRSISSPMVRPPAPAAAPTAATAPTRASLAAPTRASLDAQLGSACSQLSSDTDDEQSEDTASDAGMSVTSCSDRSGRPAPARSRSSSSVLSSVDEHRSDRKARLQELQELRASGLITEEMMEEKQHLILNGL